MQNIQISSLLRLYWITKKICCARLAVLDYYFQANSTIQLHLVEFNGETFNLIRLDAPE